MSKKGEITMKASLRQMEIELAIEEKKAALQNIEINKRKILIDLEKRKDQLAAFEESKKAINDQIAEHKKQLQEILGGTTNE